MIDHTLSWEVARVGGMLAYILATASVALGLLLSLRTTSANWPRFITNELHRFVTVLSLVFIAIHTLAVFVDPFTGFTPAEVLVPMAAHYRPFWIALGIVSGYLAIAVWASEYVRKHIGYGWWRRFHYLAFAVFLLGLLHGLGTGSDTREWWALAIYGGSLVLVGSLIAWRLVRSLGAEAWNLSVATVGISLVALALFALVGPAQPGWNELANNGNGNGASAAWLAAHPATTTSQATTPSAPTAPFSAQFDATIVADGRLSGQFSANDGRGSLQLLVGRDAAQLSMAFADGWSCTGSLTQSSRESLHSTCAGSDGSSIDVTLQNLERSGAEVVGFLEVNAG